MRNPEGVTCEVGSILGERFSRRELLSEMSISYFIFDSFFLFYLLVQTLGDDSTELDIRWKKYNSNYKK